MLYKPEPSGYLSASRGFIFDYVIIWPNGIRERRYQRVGSRPVVQYWLGEGY